MANIRPCFRPPLCALARGGLVALLMSLAAGTFARTAEALPPDEALQKAAASLKSAIAARPKGLRFALTSRVETTGGKNMTFTYRYDPAMTAAKRWMLVQPSAAEDADLRKKLIADHAKEARKAAKGKPAPDTPDQLIVVRHLHEMATQDAKFLRADGDSYIFSYRPDVGFMGRPGTEGSAKTRHKKSGKRQQAMAEAMNGEFAISRDGTQFLWIHQFSSHGFKPAAVAKINHFDLRTDFAPAWPGGPLVQVRQESQVSGKAMFHKFDQHSIVTYSGFAKR